ncbi:Conserved_hypothetical protein [Hexamita inflata]|uniref:Uncharacterized protein n=1 Tax=Hexamita inflata TaxID=28002 RepID=A0AA86PHD9_9EUKA|nr:Conserved hypothetical protein [Hexamita inflata]
MQCIVTILTVQSNIDKLVNITDCYGVDTQIEYRRNLDQIVIFLEPTNNPNCYNFPPGIDVNLTFAEINTVQPTNIGLTPYSYTIKEFNYSTTKQLVINDVPPLNGIDLQFVLVELYSYAEIIQIQIHEVVEIVSSLTECFYPNATTTISSAHLQIELTATGLCKIQINQMIKISLVMTGQILDFAVADYTDLQSLKTGYEQDLSFTVELAGDYTSLWNIQSIAARIYIATSSSAIKFTFASVYYESVANLFSTSELMLIDNSFNVLLIPNLPVFTPFMASALSKGYNALVIRINYVDLGFTVQNRYSTYDTTQELFRFTCDQNDINFDTKCLNYYKQIDATKTGNASKYRAFLELLFYQDNTVKTVHKSYLVSKHSDFDKIELKIDVKGFNFVTHYTGPLFRTPTSFTINVKTVNTAVQSLNPVLTFTQSWSYTSLAFVYSCPETNSTCKAMADQFLLETSTVIMEHMYYHDEIYDTDTAMITLVYKTDYKSTKAVAIVIGVVSCVVSAVFAGYQMIKTKRSINTLKKNKK